MQTVNLKALLATLPGAPASRLVALSGGKSGGHVFPALAVGAELRKLGFDLCFLGRGGEMEERLANSAGVPFLPVSSRPVQGRGPVARLSALVTLGLSSLRARALLRRREVAALLATGGFVSAPAILGAWLARIPVALLEPNATPGLTNRWLSRVATQAHTAYDTTGSSLRCPAEVSGVPVRAEFFGLPDVAAEAVENLLVLGGSQGAQVLNLELPRVFARLAERAAGSSATQGDALQITHQCGRGQGPKTLAAYRTALGTDSVENRFSAPGIEVSIHEFVEDVPHEMSRAQIIVSRAGAITLAEVCAAGRASVLVPLRLAGGHQESNAGALADAGAAVVLSQSDIANGAEPVLQSLLESPQRVAEMGGAARTMARRDASQRVAEHVARLAREGRTALRDSIAEKTS